jgi:hypothetical protein
MVAAHRRALDVAYLDVMAALPALFDDMFGVMNDQTSRIGRWHGHDVIQQFTSRKSSTMLLISSCVEVIAFS